VTLGRPGSTAQTKTAARRSECYRNAARDGSIRIHRRPESKAPPVDRQSSRKCGSLSHRPRLSGRRLHHDGYPDDGPRLGRQARARQGHQLRTDGSHRAAAASRTVKGVVPVQPDQHEWALHSAPRASPKRIVNAVQSKPISQTSGHNNLIPEPRRLPHTHSRAIKSP